MGFTFSKAELSPSTFFGPDARRTTNFTRAGILKKKNSGTTGAALAIEAVTIGIFKGLFAAIFLLVIFKHFEYFELLFFGGCIFINFPNNFTSFFSL